MVKHFPVNQVLTWSAPICHILYSSIQINHGKSKWISCALVITSQIYKLVYIPFITDRLNNIIQLIIINHCSLAKLSASFPLQFFNKLLITCLICVRFQLTKELRFVLLDLFLCFT
eukprot:NODE_584_length_5696_cov_0.763623.p3 type:complete len:116 gc:universal NODE_584_length_5696_cov_0.763623:2059-1712(-)